MSTKPLTSCILWEGKKNARGYGHEGRGYAHRNAYVKAYGPIPKGHVVMHLCDVPSCVNPLHLKAGTVTENQQDSKRKGRRAKVKHDGENNPRALINFEIAEQMRTIRASTGLSYPRLGKQFGVSASLARKVCIGKGWVKQ